MAKIIKKGISLTPVKFGISFTATWYNQAGALINIYNDGSMLVRDHATKKEELMQSPLSDADLIDTMLREER